MALTDLYGNAVKITSSKKQKKGLPKRTGKKKATAQAKHEARAKKRAARQAAQDAAHARNIERGFSAWDEAKERRAARRH
jgi:hypothetical protein